MSTTIITHVPTALVPSYATIYENMGATSVTPVSTGPDEVMLIIIFPNAATMPAAVGLPIEIAPLPNSPSKAVDSPG